MTAAWATNGVRSLGSRKAQLAFALRALPIDVASVCQFLFVQGKSLSYFAPEPSECLIFRLSARKIP